MKSVIKITVIICLILNLQAKARQDFSEIYLPESKNSDSFVTNLKDDKTILSGSININKNRNENLYYDLIPHHKLFFGNVSVYEDKTSFSSIRSGSDIGVKIKGEVGLLDYSTGVYNINKAGGWASINPLHFMPRLGEMDIGGGIFTNKLGVEDEKNQENTLSLFTGYKFKRFSTRGEFIRKDYTYLGDTYYDSWHLINRFALTNRLNLKASFREYEYTNSTVNDFGVEYDLGNLKLEMDTSIIRYQYDENMDSERFGIRTKYSF